MGALFSPPKAGQETEADFPQWRFSRRASEESRAVLQPRRERREPDMLEETRMGSWQAERHRRNRKLRSTQPIVLPRRLQLPQTFFALLEPPVQPLQSRPQSWLRAAQPLRQYGSKRSPPTRQSALRASLHAPTGRGCYTPLFLFPLPLKSSLARREGQSPRLGSSERCSVALSTTGECDWWRSAVQTSPTSAPARRRQE